MAALKLKLSHNSPLNTTITDSDGRLLYVISTSHLGRGTTTISRPSGSSSQTADRDVEQNESQLAAGSTGNIEELARIHWHLLRSSRVIYQGQIKDFEELMQSSDLKQARIFQGPDGRSYKWKRGWKTYTYRLELNDGSEEPKVVAQFYGHIRTRQAVLEVEDSAKSILDWIIITWIYFQRFHEGYGV